MRWCSSRQAFVGVLYLPEKGDDHADDHEAKRLTIIDPHKQDPHMIDSEHMVDWSSVVIAVILLLQGQYRAAPHCASPPGSWDNGERRSTK